MSTSDQTTPANAAFSLFNGNSGAIAENPFPSLAQLRSMGAVVPLPFPFAGMDGQAWAVTRMEEAVQILKDHAHFTVDRSSLGGKSLFGRNTAEAADTPTFFTSKTMLTVDEPDHRRLRLQVSKAFTPRYIESSRPQVQEIADELLDRVQDQGQMDLVEDYAFRLPINVIARMLGGSSR
jgi:cytochrome P450